MTDNRTNEPTAEQIVRGVRKLLNHYSLRGDVPCDEIDKLIDDSEAGLLSEGTPSGAMVEAAARALHETRNPWFAAYGDWGAAGFEIKQAFRESARAALVAAQGAAPPVNSFDTTAEREKTGADSLHVAPQAPSGVTNANGHSWMSWDESGKNGTYCRSCGGWAGKVGNRQCSPAPVLPSSAVDEYALANLIHSTSVAHFGGLDPRVAPIIARAVAEWLKGEER